MYINSLRLFNCTSNDNKSATIKEDTLQHPNSTKLNMKYILSDIDYLIRLNEQQLQSSEAIPYVRKVNIVFIK